MTKLGPAIAGLFAVALTVSACGQSDSNGEESDTGDQAEESE